MKCALIVGHEAKNQGAENRYSKISEYNFNSMLAISIQRLVRNVEVEVVYRDVNGYKKLPRKVNNTYPDFIISLHCNSCNDPSISGSEVLYWGSSKRGKMLASLLQDSVSKVMLNRSRGIKAIKSEKERGGLLLKNTSAPCVILEPFFISNFDDLQAGIIKYNELAQAVAIVIDEVKNKWQ